MFEWPRCCCGRQESCSDEAKSEPEPFLASVPDLSCRGTKDEIDESFAQIREVGRPQAPLPSVDVKVDAELLRCMSDAVDV